MVSEISIYVEGAGEVSNNKTKFRKAYKRFFAPIDDAAQGKHISFKVIVCGGRGNTFSRFQTALKTSPLQFNVLLVDSEGPVANIKKPWEHLQKLDRWSKPEGCNDTHCHLMVQVMETWFIADREQLQKYYGSDFYDQAIPARKDVENIPKDKVSADLKKATKSTTKREYHKTKHAPSILESLRLDVVSEKAPACARLVEMLKKQIDENR